MVGTGLSVPGLPTGLSASGPPRGTVGQPPADRSCRPTNDRQGAFQRRQAEVGCHVNLIGYLVADMGPVGLLEADMGPIGRSDADRVLKLQ